MRGAIGQHSDSSPRNHLEKVLKNELDLLQQRVLETSKRGFFFYLKKSLRASARSVSPHLAIPQITAFYFLKPCFGTSFALSSPIQLPLSSVVLCPTASAHLDTAPSRN